MNPGKKTRGFFAEFRKFVLRGNVLDLAVGVIIGGAFSAITNSLVNDIINPILGIFLGGNESFSSLQFSLPGGGDLMLGNFINAVLNFLIMAFVIFCIVKACNALRDRADAILHKKQAEAQAEAPAPPEPTNEEKLLMEIRDLLKDQTK